MKIAERFKSLSAYRNGAFFLIWFIWVASVLLTAFELRKFIPKWIFHHAHVVHLFHKRVNAWFRIELQGRFAGGERRWVDLNLNNYSGMDTYGYLTRLDRILNETAFAPRGRGVRRAMSRYIALAHARRFPESPALREIRFVRVSIPVGGKGSANPVSRWARPALENVPPAWVQEVEVVTYPEWSRDEVRKDK